MCWHTSCQYNTIVDQGGRRLAASRQPVALKCPAHPLASGKGESCECSHGDEPWGSQVPLRPACWRAHLQPPRACRYHTAGPRRPSRRLDHDDQRLRLAHPPRVAGAGPPLYPSPCTRAAAARSNRPWPSGNHGVSNEESVVTDLREGVPATFAAERAMGALQSCCASENPGKNEQFRCERADPQPTQAWSLAQCCSV